VFCDRGGCAAVFYDQKICLPISCLSFFIFAQTFNSVF
jgi:hypothetical protein